ncbi:MAG: hypothetical protein ACXWUP_11410 [Allosphingosinicella sp.]
MKLLNWPVLAAIGLAVAGCDAGGPPAADGGNDLSAGNGSASAGNATEAANAAGAAPALAACPFRRTSGWNGSIERGRLVVGGQVDLQMAGMRPTLTARSGGGDTLQLDLAMVPEPQAAVTDRARYETAATRSYRRGEIWCGGERIGDFEFVLID